MFEIVAKVQDSRGLLLMHSLTHPINPPVLSPALLINMPFDAFYDHVSLMYEIVVKVH